MFNVNEKNLIDCVLLMAAGTGAECWKIRELKLNSLNNELSGFPEKGTAVTAFNPETEEGWGFECDNFHYAVSAYRMMCMKFRKDFILSIHVTNFNDALRLMVYYGTNQLSGELCSDNRTVSCRGGRKNERY